MRSPLTDLFPVEAVSESKLTALLLLLVIIDVVGVLLVSFGGRGAPPDLSALGSDFAPIMDGFTQTAKVFAFVFIMTFGNASLVYLNVVLTGSAEGRLLLRWLLHASVWTLLVIVAWHVAGASWW